MNSVLRKLLCTGFSARARATFCGLSLALVAALPSSCGSSESSNETPEHTAKVQAALVDGGVGATGGSGSSTSTANATTAASSEFSPGCVSCETAECCDGTSAIIELTNGPDFYPNSTGNICVLALDGSDIIQASGPESTIVAAAGDDLVQRAVRGTVWSGPGNDRVFASDGGNIYGNAGSDELTVSGANSVVIGGPGKDTVRISGGPNAVAAILDVCEIERGDAIYSDGNATLITPVPLEKLVELGVLVSGFSASQIKVERHSCSSECAAGNDCSEHGTCSESTDGFKCNCEQGWEGEHCETDIKCSPEKPCGPGKQCGADSDCEGQLVCAIGAGPLYDKAPGSDVCASPICFPDPHAGGCGIDGAQCGKDCDGLNACKADAECSAGQTCSDGRCQCKPSCEGKACGAADGCGGRCRLACAEREQCLTNADCKLGLVCIIGAGPRVGLPAGTNVCLPRTCDDFDPARMSCGDETSLCGKCPEEPLNCTGRTCGPDATGHGSCGSCGENEFCSEGSCQPRPIASVRTRSIPDGIGGIRRIEPFPVLSLQGFGSIPGRFGVSERGLATYSINVVVPPARTLVPEISLNYVSQKLPGLSGVGWSIGGLSTISRCPKTGGQDKITAPIQHDQSDRYCLDGMPLVAKNAAVYGKAGTIYRTEPDTGVKVVSHDGFGTSGPSSFTVWTTDGLIKTYGGIDAAVKGLNGTMRAWPLSRTEDRAKNYWTVTYTISSNPASKSRETIEVFPRLIAYNGSSFGGPGRKPDRSIEFVYDDDRFDRFSGYAFGGMKLARTRLLRDVVTRIGYEVVRNYHIEYDGNSKTVNRVTSVRECTALGCQKCGDNGCTAATTFEYQDEVGFEDPKFTGFYPFSDGPGPVFPTYANAFQWFPADLDGDGKDDLVVHRFVPASNVVYWHWDALPSVGRTTVGAHYGFKDWTDTPVARQGYLYQKGVQFETTQNHVLDLNLDGGDDLLNSSAVPLGQNALALTWTGSESKLLPAEGEKATHQSPLPIDVDADGLKDIVVCSLVKESVKGRTHYNKKDLKYYPGTENGSFSEVAIDLPEPSDNDRCPAADIDVDGDGIPNLLLNGEVYIPSLKAWQKDRGLPSGNQPGERFVDFNGDGLKDLVALPVGAKNAFRVWQNTGSGFVELSQEIVAEREEFFAGVAFDYDGDGKEDLLFPGPPDLEPRAPWRFLRGTNNGFEERSIDIPLDPPTLGAKPIKRHVAKVADVDGDENPDLLLLAKDGELVVFHGRGRKANLLTAVTDGFGKRYEVAYSAGFSAEPTYVPGQECDAVARCEHHVGPLVSAQTVSQAFFDSNGDVEKKKTERTYTYRYFDGRTDARGRGWLGFAVRLISEFDGGNRLLQQTKVEYDNTTTESTLSTAGIVEFYPYAGRAKGVTALFPEVETSLGGSPIKSSRVVIVENQWATKSSTKHAGSPDYILSSRLPYIKNKITRIFDLVTGSNAREVVRTDESFDIDNYGNRTHQDSYSYRPGNDFKTEFARSSMDVTFEVNESDWLVASPKQVKITDALAPNLKQPKTRTTEYAYYANGLLHTLTHEPGNPDLQLKTTYDRDDFGRPWKTTVASQADEKLGKGRSTTIDFDPEHLYPEFVRNSLGQTTTVEFDRRTGALTLAADANGIYEQWARDVFGRLTYHKSPQLTETIDYRKSHVYVADGTEILGAYKVTRDIAGGGHSEQVFDPMGRVVAQTVAGLKGAPVFQEFSYNEAGVLTRRSRPHLAGDMSQGAEEYLYDARLRLSKSIAADQRTSTISYGTDFTVDKELPWLDSMPNTCLYYTGTTDPLNHRDVACADVRGNNVASVDAKQAVTTYEYESFNALKTSFGLVSKVSLVNDLYGRLTRESDPDRGQREYRYSAYGELTFRKDGKGQTTDLFYDELGRLYRQVDADGETRFTFDQLEDGTPVPNGIGRLASTKSASGHETLVTYEAPTAMDNRGLVSKITERYAAGVERSVGFDYTAFGQIDKITYPESNGRPFVIQHGYDAAGNLERVGDEGFKTTYWQVLSHYQGYLIGDEALGAKAQTSYAYQAKTGRLEQLVTNADSDQVQNLYFQYLADGKLWTRNDLNASGQFPEIMEYDELGRLLFRKQATTAGSNVLDEMRYEADGNLKFKSGVGDYKYDWPNGATPHAVRTAGEHQFEYDGNGNQKFRKGHSVVGGEQTIEFTAFDLPKLVKIGADKREVSFAYNAAGERVAKQSDGVITRYLAGLYEEQADVATNSAKSHKYFVFGGGRVVAQVSRQGGSASIPDDVLYIHGDHLGSPNVITDAAGKRVHEEEFDSFGRANNPTWSTSRTGHLRIGYTGHEQDPETGLVNMKGRIYDPVIARFTTPDPFVTAPFWSQGHNPYSYVFNSPHNLVDPTGFYTEDGITDSDEYVWDQTCQQCTPQEQDTYQADPLLVNMDSGDPAQPEPTWEMSLDDAQMGVTAGDLYEGPTPIIMPNSQASPYDASNDRPMTDGAGSQSGSQLMPSGEADTEMMGFLPGVGNVFAIGDVAYAAVTGDTDTMVYMAVGIVVGRGVARIGGKVISFAGARLARSALRRALEKAAGGAAPAGHHAHHIVALMGRNDASAPARAVLEKFGIGMNEAANGLFLPAQQHLALHTDEYYRAVNQALSAATTRQDALAILGSIAEALRAGGYP